MTSLLRERVKCTSSISVTWSRYYQTVWYSVAVVCCRCCRQLHHETLRMMCLNLAEEWPSMAVSLSWTAWWIWLTWLRLQALWASLRLSLTGTCPQEASYASVSGWVSLCWIGSSVSCENFFLWYAPKLPLLLFRLFKHPSVYCSLDPESGL